jgi:hypothetical protein
MTDILLCGAAADMSFAEALIPALKHCGGLCYAGRDAVEDCVGSAEYFLYECTAVPKIGIEKGILLFKEHLGETTPARVPPGFICVIGSKNEQAAELLHGVSAAVVTYGTGPKDTLSLAGLDASEASVSLQRNLLTLNGKLLEPHDFSVKLTRQRTPEQVLAVSAVLLLAGVDSEQGYLI